VITSIIMNAIVIVYGIVAIVLGGDQCDKPLLILGVVMLVAAMLNAAFSYYMYYTINHDENNPLFREQNNDDPAALKPSAKLYEFFKYDKWMACYIIFAVLVFALCVTVMALSNDCKSEIGSGVFAVSILLLAYLVVVTLILFSYVAFDAFKEWARQCVCWLVPFCWPCLLVGCCLNCTEDLDKSYREQRPNKHEYVAPQQPAPEQMAPVVVVQQPTNFQPPPQQQQVYVQAQPYVQPQPYVQAQPVQQPMYNPQGVQPGVLVVHQQYQQPQQPQQQQTNGTMAAQNVNNNNDNNNDSNQVDYDEIKQKAKAAGAAAGKQAKKTGAAALGWMAKKMNDLNDKVQDKDAQAQNNAEGGGEGAKKTY